MQGARVFYPVKGGLLNILTEVLSLLSLFRNNIEERLETFLDVEIFVLKGFAAKVSVKYQLNY